MCTNFLNDLTCVTGSSRQLMEWLPEPVIVFREYTVVYANPAAMQLVGAASRGEMIGRTILDFVESDPEQLECTASQMDSLLRLSAPSELMVKEWVRPDRQRVRIQMRAIPVEYDGAPALMMLCKDITHQLFMEHTVQRSELMMLRMVELSPNAVVLHKDGIVHYVNEAAAKIFRAGYAAELIGRNIYDFIHPDYHLISSKRLKLALEKRTKLEFAVHKMIRADGDVFDAEVSSVGFTDARGNEYIQTVLRDVTERIAYEEELKDSSLRYQRLIKFLPEPIVITDMGEIIYCNKSMARLVKAANDGELVGRNVLEFTHPDYHESSLEAARSVMLSDEPTPFQERKLICRDGAVITVEMSSIKLYNYKGKAVTLSVIRDLTERKQAEELLLRSEKLSLVGQLAAGVAHEIRNPLTSLRGFTQLLQRNLDTNKYYYIDTMLSELDRINFIVNDFMSLSKPQLIDFRLRDLRAMLESVVMTLESETALRNVTIEWERVEPLPLISCDEHRMKQVFLNLLKNAIDAMPNGGRISLRLARNGAFASVRIRDEGCGMPKEMIEKVGEPFFTTKADGTGLGLMICNHIMEEHGGALRFESEVGVGTTAEITLPIDGADE